MSRIVLLLALIACCIAPAFADDAAPAPAPAAPAPAPDPAAIDAVLGDLAKIGPEQLTARVADIKKQVGDLQAQAGESRKKADELDAAAAAAAAKVDVIEKFIAALNTAMQPAAPAAPAPEAAPAPAPAPEAAPAAK